MGSRQPPIPASPLRLTIGIVTLDAAEVLERALTSVLRHRSPALELVVLDGGSRDGTVEMLRRYDAEIDLWRTEADAGIYDAMNKLLQVASGDWLLFLGSDDELLASPHQLLQHCRQPRTVYYGDVRIRGSGQISGGSFSRYRLMQQNICHQGILYPRSVYKAKAYDTKCGLLADHRYNIELMGAGTRFEHIEETVSVFNDAGRSSTGAREFESLKLETIRASFGWPFYAIKRLRSAGVRLAKGRHVST
jgi:glycosyltransferase involved in cell wall biosynthesis